MPPKQSKKAAEKATKKVVEDKTFGLKNKNKSSKVQKYVEEVAKQASDNAKRKQAVAAGGSARTAGLPPAPTKKELEAQKKAELAELFKPVQVQKVPFGTDPKTVLCAFFKSGQCQKGAKCKFSHDLGIERKVAKIDVYADKRDTTSEKENDTMDAWDQSKLESVITSKHGNPKTTTDIVCKYFLEAIENAKYGWFWTCPNGGDTCKYRHALPPGYVLKPKAVKRGPGDEDDEEEKITLEEFLETERHQLGADLTPVTLETFTAWKAKRLAKKASEKAEQEKAKEAAARSGRRIGLSGRDLFTYHGAGGDVVASGDGQDDDDDAFDLSTYLRQHGALDQAAEETAQRQADQARQAGTAAAEAQNGSSASHPPRGGSAATDGGEVVDESLFEGEDLENLQLDDLEE